MANVRLKNTSVSTYGDIITVSIIDVDGANSEIPFEIEQPFYNIQFNGNKNDPFDSIRTISIDGNIILDENTEFIFDDVFNAQEGRFYVRVEIEKPSDTVTYTCKIVQDGMELDDRVKPTFYFKAIDGLTDLKSKEFDIEDAYFKVSDAICHCLNKLDIVTVMETTPTLLVYSEIEPNSAAYASGRLLDRTWTNDYFYRTENEERKPFNCYEVLVELLTRLNLQLFLYGDRFYCIGNETIFAPSITKFAANYDVTDGSFISSRDLSTNPIFNSINIANSALAGGRYFFTSGYKKVTIESDPKFSNRKVGDTKLLKLVYPAITSVAYTRLPGIVKKDKTYRLAIIVDVVNITKANNDPTIPGLFTVTHNIREENIETSTQTVIHTNFPMYVPTNIGKYTNELIIPEEDYYRFMDASVSISGLSGTNMTSMVVNVSYLLAEQLQNYDTIKVISEIPTSKFVKEKTIKMYGNHHKGNELVEFYFQSTTSGITYTKEFRIFGGAWTPLEELIAEDQLYWLGNRIELDIQDNDDRDAFITPVTDVQYKLVNYKLIGFNYNVHSNIYNLELLRQSDNTGTIITTYEVPVNSSNLNTSDYGTVSAMTGNIDRYFGQYYSEHSNVTGTYITADLDQYFNGPTDEIKRYWNVYVNGIRYTYKAHADVSSPPDPGDLNIQEFTYKASENRLYFGYDLEGSYVILHFIGISKPQETA
jgi:hypothetical protein